MRQMTPAERRAMKAAILKVKDQLKRMWSARGGSVEEDRAADALIDAFQELAEKMEPGE